MLQSDKVDKVDKGKIYFRGTAVLKQKTNVGSVNCSIMEHLSSLACDCDPETNFPKEELLFVNHSLNVSWTAAFPHLMFSKSCVEHVQSCWMTIYSLV